METIKNYFNSTLKRIHLQQFYLFERERRRPEKVSPFFVHISASSIQTKSETISKNFPKFLLRRSTNPGASTISGQRYRPRKQYCNNVSFSFCFAGEPPTTGILLKYAHCAHGDKLVFDRNLRSFSIYFFVPFHKRHCLQGNTIGAIIK